MSADVTDALPLLQEGAARLGFALTTREVELFQLYYEMLVDWNARMNLTAITDYDGVQVKHFLDSLTVGAALAAEGVGIPGSIADIGTGAGFPGLPLKIVWPGVRLLLADSIGKKTLFLQEVATALRLPDVEVVKARAEELGANKAYREKYDLATARAVAALPVLCEYLLPLLKTGGWMAAPKKGDISLELQEARKASKAMGGGEPRLHPFRLPDEEEERVVVLIRKERPTPPGYPRRVGLAKARPVGANPAK